MALLLEMVKPEILHFASLQEGLKLLLVIDGHQVRLKTRWGWRRRLIVTEDPHRTILFEVFADKSGEMSSHRDQEEPEEEAHSTGVTI